MSKLEKKLQEMGYQDSLFEDRNIYFKWVNSTWRVAFEIDDENIIDATIGLGTNNLHNDEELYKDEELSQQALKQMRKDLEELKNVKNS